MFSKSVPRKSAPPVHCHMSSNKMFIGFVLFVLLQLAKNQAKYPFGAGPMTGT